MILLDRYTDECCRKAHGLAPLATSHSGTPLPNSASRQTQASSRGMALTQMAFPGFKYAVWSLQCSNMFRKNCLDWFGRCLQSFICEWTIVMMFLEYCYKSFREIEAFDDEQLQRPSLNQLIEPVVSSQAGQMERVRRLLWYVLYCWPCFSMIDL